MAKTLAAAAIHMKDIAFVSPLNFFPSLKRNSIVIDEVIAINLMDGIESTANRVRAY